jgi:hypothetical protein
VDLIEADFGFVVWVSSLTAEWVCEKKFILLFYLLEFW